MLHCPNGPLWRDQGCRCHMYVLVQHKYQRSANVSLQIGAISANVGWRLPEVNIGIVCANAPVFRPLYLYYQGRLASQQTSSRATGSTRKMLARKDSWQKGSWVSTLLNVRWKNLLQNAISYIGLSIELDQKISLFETAFVSYSHRQRVTLVLILNQQILTFRG